ncbi:helix-turn-helix domain-containing protein [Bifidobacterium amazonense]|uniref:Helix-turn-helix domain-containing protein n=1 Tax=Bifidobacterium amazonense TaxID=2809027 RepID=A0ABS9VV26_9BIFI|nr:helix-turn-helix transcriptional regulator [Bifidobacterium amazonense]MCH9275660.1 helix-turn-helix domain-containing protein [Bifidobacterium amazonense]
MANEIDTRAQLFGKYLGAELKGAIRSRGYSQAEIADRLGHARSSFANWLNAKPSIPVEVAEKICLCIGVELKEIVGRAHQRVNEEMGAYGTERMSEQQSVLEQLTRVIGNGRLNYTTAAYRDENKKREMETPTD